MSTDIFMVMLAENCPLLDGDGIDIEGIKQIVGQLAADSALVGLTLRVVNRDGTVDKDGLAYLKFRTHDARYQGRTFQIQGTRGFTLVERQGK